MINNEKQTQGGSLHLFRLSHRILLVFLIGIFIGYGLAILRAKLEEDQGKSDITAVVNQSDGSNAIANAPLAAPTPRKPSLNDAVVRIEVHDTGDGSIHHTRGIVTANEYTLVLPLPTIKNASDGTLVTSRGHSFPLQQVIGENIDYGIVAVKSELSSGMTLQISDEQGALYLGREFTALADDHSTSGWVDSLSFKKPNGATTYLVKLQRPMDWQGGAMIDPQTSVLIGIAMAATNDPTIYEVIDTTEIQRLIESIPGTMPLKLADYSKYYYEQTPTGMLENIQMLVNAEDWDKAIHLAGDLLLHHPDYQARINPYLEKAYQFQIRTYIESNDPDNALALLDDAKRRLDESAQRLVLRADISEKLGDLQGAREFLHQAIESDHAVRDTVIPRIRRLVLMEINEQGLRLSGDAVIELLQDEIADDPDYAIYYSLLGKQYFKLGQYRESVFNMQNAIRLDPALAQELTPMINIAQQRRDTPGLIEVPLFASGNVYYVIVRLNGLPRQFRFMIDTGATFSAVSNNVAKILGILLSDNPGVLTLSTANGVIQAPLRKLKSMDLDGAIVNDVDVVILETMNDFDGLIGLSYLDHFDVNINQSEQKLMLVRR